MTIARRQLIDVDVTRWYHCMSRCVRGASLLGNESSARKEWLEKRIEGGAKTGIVSRGGAKTGIASRERRQALRRSILSGSEDRHCVGRFYRERRQALRRSILSQSRQGVARNWQD
jgi:hypothetical protein